MRCRRDAVDQARHGQRHPLHRPGHRAIGDVRPRGLPTLLATAAAPMIGTWLLEWVGPNGMLVFLFGAALLHVALVVPLVPMALRQPRGG